MPIPSSESVIRQRSNRLPFGRKIRNWWRAIMKA
nr:MAG TPA: hypothetical protein [Caudoviricetes sp.]